MDIAYRTLTLLGLPGMSVVRGRRGKRAFEAGEDVENDLRELK
jgi:hypothetical protein